MYALRMSVCGCVGVCVWLYCISLDDFDALPVHITKVCCYVRIAHECVCGCVGVCGCTAFYVKTLMRCPCTSQRCAAMYALRMSFVCVCVCVALVCGCVWVGGCACGCRCA